MSKQNNRTSTKLGSKAMRKPPIEKPQPLLETATSSEPGSEPGTLMPSSNPVSPEDASESSGETREASKQEQRANPAEVSEEGTCPAVALADLSLSPASPNADPVAEALTCGRVFNRIGNYLQQFLFFEEFLEPARKLAHELSMRLRLCVHTHSTKDMVEDQVKRRLLPVIKLPEGEEENSRFVQWSIQCSFPPSDDQEITLAVDIRAFIVSNYRAMLHKLHKALSPYLTVQQQRMFRLGELIDQLVCPPDVYLDLDKPVKGSINVGFPMNWLNLENDRPRAHTESGKLTQQPRREWQSSLAQHMRLPGEAAPREAWWENLVSAWHECGLEAVIPPPIKPTDDMSSRDRCQYARQLADAARMAYESIPAAEPRRLSRKKDQRIWVTDKSAYELMLDGKRHRIDDPTAFRLMEFFIKAGRPHSGKSIKRQLGIVDKMRLSDLINLLPIRLRALIHSHSDRRGGYWLQLPTDKGDQVSPSSCQ